MALSRSSRPERTLPAAITQPSGTKLPLRMVVLQPTQTWLPTTMGLSSLMRLPLFTEIGCISESINRQSHETSTLSPNETALLAMILDAAVIRKLSPKHKCAPSPTTTREPGPKRAKPSNFTLPRTSQTVGCVLTSTIPTCPKPSCTAPTLSGHMTEPPIFPSLTHFEQRMRGLMTPPAEISFINSKRFQNAELFKRADIHCCTPVPRLPPGASALKNPAKST